ncbi:hypothetical protein [Halodesulfovibrio marinisediminis]|uniref:Uncharacterized protein n=1 Tax=Halodesulfovibrio marinisediminis DSM 17456 TaxID=1121457 RepID=A0A1N6FXK0_9BACT|nr:hypothetical protein [Halodesulfovibrio marinisediminis]SIO00029.1 hypothetical protein SAMN02745161_1571 [Halodesulfovibrio marinisediminis DSM 17456]
MKRLLCFVLICITFTVLTAFAEAAPKTTKATQSAQPKADKPAVITSRTTPIFIEQKGADNLGSMLAFELKSTCNTTSLFKMTGDDVPKITVMLTTMSEFTDRPTIGSVYSIVWVFSENANNLKYYLAQDTGIVTAENVTMLATSIANKTDQIALQYGYLFE